MRNFANIMSKVFAQIMRIFFFLETVLSSVLSKDFRIVSKVARCSQILLQPSYDKRKKNGESLYYTRNLI
jgi:hypothetical protein